MEYNSEDKTLERNYQKKWKNLIREYEEIKGRRHTRYRFVEEFFKVHGISRQLFNKIYNRYKDSGKEEDLLPQTRGPKWCSRRIDIKIEREVIEERKKGLNKYEICDILSRRHGQRVVSPSVVYKISKRNGMNILREKEKEIKRKIIKENPGELGHIDCHYISKGLIESDIKKQYYLVCVIDSCSRIAWAEVLEDIKSLSVMFATMRIFNVIKKNYNIEFASILSDNGAEFASPKNKNTHPFERMLLEVRVKHSYTRPYRPQTNGKVERFWRTIKDDLLEGEGFKDIEEFKDRLFEYLIYYNEIRNHQSLNGQSPLAFLHFCQRIT
jgi:transposase InsO family protein